MNVDTTLTSSAFCLLVFLAMRGMTDPYLKLDWAKHHLDLLDTELQAFHKSEPCRFSTREDFENQRYILRLEMLDVPDRIPLICGDAFYCMRSCLDQLVWRLAKLNITIPDNTQFPITSKWDNDSIGRFNSHLRGVPEEAIGIIRDFQPANRPDAVEQNFLWRLNALCNLDKHRRIAANGSELNFRLPKAIMEFVTRETFYDHAIISVPLARKSELDLHPDVSFNVIFGDPTSRVTLGPDDIRDIYQFLSEKVLPRFMRFFT